VKKIFESKEAAQSHANEMKDMLREKGVVVENIPDLLKEKEQWVVWVWSVTQSRDGFQTTKIPINCDGGRQASHSNPETWSSFEKALETYNKDTNISGVGYVFSKDDGLVGIDFDNCIDESKQIHPEIMELIEPYENYMEASPSMTGLKVVGLGEIPKDALNTEAGSGFKIHDYPNDSMDVEVYQHSRFFTITSMKMRTKPAEVVNIQGLIDIFAGVKKESKNENDFQVQADLTPEEISEEISHEEFVAEFENPTPETLQPQEKAPSFESKTPSVNGNGVRPTAVDIVSKIMDSRQASVFNSLYYEGNTSSYPSHSEADLALTSILCWWCQGDRMEAEKIFAGSRLVRDKWEKRQDYRDGLWQKADSGNYYVPQELKDPKDLTPIISLERQIDVVSGWLKESDSFNNSQNPHVLPDSVRYDEHRVILDCVINGKTVSRLLVSDYVCIGLGINPMSTWKRDSSGKFADPESKTHWRDINNFAAEIVGNTGGWGKTINRHLSAAEEALEALKL